MNGAITFLFAIGFRFVPPESSDKLCYFGPYACNQYMEFVLGGYMDFVSSYINIWIVYHGTWILYRFKNAFILLTHLEVFIYLLFVTSHPFMLVGSPGSVN